MSVPDYSERGGLPDLGERGPGPQVATEEYVAALRKALVQALAENHRLERELAGAAARAQQLTTILEHQGKRQAGHDRLLERVTANAQQQVQPRYRLRLFTEDKYQIEEPAIDCVARLPICKGRCCSFDFELTAQDVNENATEWEPDKPFLIRHEADGFCAHWDRGSGGCTNYEKRPTTCRTFTCHDDQRIWIDFDKRIAHPWPPKPPTPPGEES